MQRFFQTSPLSRRIHSLSTIAALFLWFVSPNLHAAKYRSKSQLKRRIESIIPEKKFRSLQAGVLIASLEKGDILYARDTEKLLIPASVNKIFTAFTVLKTLGPNSTFKTEVYATQPIRDGVLMGDLYLRGGGDPSLVSERMWMLVNELLRIGIKKVNGNIIGDDSYFDKKWVPGTRPSYLKDQAYNAPIGALSFNFNTATVYVQPSEKVGKPPEVYVDPENSYIDVVNQAKTGNSRSRQTLSVSRIDHVKGDLGDTVLLRGSIPSNAKEVRYYRNIVNPTLYACHMFQQFLSRRKVKVGGVVKEGVVPRGATRLLEFDSLPMWHIVWGMNKFSNNFVADQLLKKMGATQWGIPGSLKKGLDSIYTEMAKIGIPKGSYTIADGSGLTRQSKVSATQVYKVLKAAYEDFSIYPEFVASLGIAGQDGTVRSRFLSSSAINVLRAKTGSLNGVSSLAGFTPSADGEMLAFVVLLNDPKRKYGRMAGWVDKIALAARNFERAKK